MENSLIPVGDEQSSTGAAVADKPAWKPGTLGKFCLVTLKVEGVKAGCRKVTSHRFNVGELAPIDCPENDQVMFATRTAVIPDGHKADALNLCTAKLGSVQPYFRTLQKATAVLYYSCERTGDGMVSNHMFAAFEQQVAL